MKKSLMVPLLGVAMVLTLAACGTATVGGGAVTTNALGERRGGDEFVEDNWIAWKIRTAYMKSEKVKLGNVNVQVYRGRVLLTGTANAEQEVKEAIRIAREIRGVADVASELRVQYVGPLEYANDALITNKVKVQLLANDKVRGLDIHVETTKAVVYLIGEAATVEERDHAVQLARNVSGVKEVVSYIMVNKDAYPLTPMDTSPGNR